MNGETLKFEARKRPGDIDAALLRAEAKVVNLLVSLACLDEPDLPASEHRLIDELCATIEWIRTTEPQSLVGAAVKLRVLLHPDLGTGPQSPEETALPLRQVLKVIEGELVRRAKAA
jgi:hypothetical protein